MNLYFRLFLVAFLSYSLPIFADLKCDIEVVQVLFEGEIKYARSFEIPLDSDVELKFHESTSGWNLSGPSLGCSPNINSFFVSFFFNSDKTKLLVKNQFVKFDFTSSVTHETHYPLLEDGKSFEIFSMSSFGERRAEIGYHQSSFDDLNEGHFLSVENPGFLLSGTCALVAKDQSMQKAVEPSSEEY